MATLSGPPSEKPQRFRSARSNGTRVSEACEQRARIEAVSSRPVAAQQTWRNAQRRPRVCLTFEVSGPEPGWSLAREADDDLKGFAGQGPSRLRSARPKG